MKRFLLCLFLLIFASGCRMADKEEPIAQPRYTIGIVLKSMDSEHWLAVRSGMQRAAEDYQVNVLVLYAQDESAKEEQKQMIFDLLENNIDALAVSPCDVSQSKAYFDYAREKKIPAFSIDEIADGIPYIGSNNYHIGEMAAQYIVDQLSRHGSIGIISGNMTQNAHSERVAGFKDYLAAHTEMKVIDCRSAGSSLKKASVQTEEMLMTHPDIKGIFVTNAMMALGVIESKGMMRFKERVRVVGVDTQQDVILAIMQGKIDAMVSQSGYDIGYLAIATIIQSLDQGLSQDQVYINNDLITKENASQYSLPLNYNSK